MKLHRPSRNVPETMRAHSILEDERRYRPAEVDQGDARRSFGTILTLLVLVFFLSIPARVLAASSVGAADPFAEAPFLLLDEELLLITDSGTDVETTLFLPDSDKFVDGEWRNLRDRVITLNRVPPPEGGRMGDAAAMLRNDRNEPFLARAWEPGDGSSQATVSIAPVNLNGYGSEAAGFSLANAERVALAAGDFTRDGATELVIGYRETTPGDSGKPAFVIALASSSPDPVSFSDPGLPRIHADSGLRIAVGDVDGDGRPEVAALYVSTDNTFIAALFSVDYDRAMRTLGVHRLGPATPSAVSAEHFDIVFADWNGNGREMIYCATLQAVTPGTSALSAHVALLGVERSSESASFTNILSDTYTDPSYSTVRPGIRAQAGDLDGDGYDELIVAAPMLVPFNYSDNFIAICYKRAASGFLRSLKGFQYADGATTVPSGERVALRMGAFTGRLHPSAAANNRSQAVLALQAENGATSLSLLSLRNNNLVEIDSWPVRAWTSFHLLAADLDGDSMLLGTPTHITLENQVTPLLFLNEPPKHIDPDASGKVTNHSRYSELFIQYSQSEEDRAKTTNTLGVEGNLGTSLAIDRERGISLGRARQSQKTNRLKVTISSSVGAKYEEMEEKFSSQSASLTGQTNRDDFVLYRCHTIQVWRYPILGWQLAAEEEGDREGQAFHQVAIPDASAEDQAVHLIAGRNVDWYHPVHMNGNVLSYPSSSAQIPDFDQENLLSQIVTLDVGGGNSATRSINWSEGVLENTLESLSVSMKTDVEKQFQASTKGKRMQRGVTRTYDFHMDSRLDTTSTSQTSVTKENAFKMEVPAISSPLAYTITPLMYASDGGVLKTPHVAGNIAGRTAWTAHYASAPDPALNLPRIWMFKGVDRMTDEETWEWIDDETENPDARKIRGIFFRNAEGVDIGPSFPVGEIATIAVRVHNFSLTDCPSVTVRFEAAPYDPNTGERGTSFVLGTARTQPIDRWGAQAPNWRETTFDWNTSGVSEGNYQMLVTLDPDGQINELPGRALNEAFDNNRGWFNVFVHRKESVVAAEAAARGMSAVASNLRAGLNVANAPVDGGAFETGESILFRGSVENDGITPKRSVKVFFFDGDPARGGTAFAGRTIPGIPPGETYTLMVNHAFETPGNRIVHMRVVPKQGDPVPEDNTAVVSVRVGHAGDSGGGCSAGAAGDWSALLLLAGLLPLTAKGKE